MIQLEYFFDWNKTSRNEEDTRFLTTPLDDLDFQSPPSGVEKPQPVPHSPRKTAEINDAVYDRLPNHRKRHIVALLSFCAFLAPISSTAVLSAVPEVAEEFETTGAIINLSNAFYMLFMGISPCFWGPLSQVYGRRWICVTTAVLFFFCSVGTALAPNLPAFFVFRILTAFEGTSFLIVGSSCIGDIYRPTERATAMGWFLSGTLIGPAFGPFLGGLIVTYRSWRVIFWLQAVLAGSASLGAYLILPETIHYKKSSELAGLPFVQKALALAAMINPWRVLKLYRYPNLIVVGLASSSLIWNMYSLLTPIRYVLNPRFALTSPIQSGLFYLPPGCGYVVGTLFGGRHADQTVKKWMGIRGVRISEDRLRSCLPFLAFGIPACMFVYGWSIELEMGGVPLPVFMMFLQGIFQFMCFPSLNTYCLDVMQSASAEVIAGNFVVRYLFAAVATATVLPAVDSIGLGWFSTVSSLFLMGSGACLWATIQWGKGWREGIEAADEGKKERTWKKGYVGLRDTENEASEPVEPDADFDEKV